MAKVKYIKTQRAKEIDLSNYPSCHITASIKGMRDKYWGKDALIVKSGNYYYNVSSSPEIYHNEAH